MAGLPNRNSIKSLMKIYSDYNKPRNTTRTALYTLKSKGRAKNSRRGRSGGSSFPNASQTSLTLAPRSTVPFPPEKSCQLTISWTLTNTTASPGYSCLAFKHNSPYEPDGTAGRLPAWFSELYRIYSYYYCVGSSIAVEAYSTTQYGDLVVFPGEVNEQANDMSAARERKFAIWSTFLPENIPARVQNRCSMKQLSGTFWQPTDDYRSLATGAPTTQTFWYISSGPRTAANAAIDLTVRITYDMHYYGLQDPDDAAAKLSTITPISDDDFKMELDSKISFDEGSKQKRTPTPIGVRKKC